MVTCETAFASQVKAALAAGLGVCVCVGETEAERKAKKTFAVVEKQIKAILPSVASENWGKVRAIARCVHPAICRVLRPENKRGRPRHG